MKGSSVPIDIYTYDCLQDQVFREERKRASKTDVKTPGKGYCLVQTLLLLFF